MPKTDKIPQRQQYTIYIERDDMFADPERFPDGIAWCSGIRDKHGEEIDGGCDIASYEEAKELALNALVNLLAKGAVDKEKTALVRIEVSGGVAECTSSPPDVEVEIIDHDNEEG